MTDAALRFLIVENEPPEARALRRASAGGSSGDTYAETLRELAPASITARLKAADPGEDLPDGRPLLSYDAVFLTGSPLHLYEDTRETRRTVELMRAIFASGTPSFGSCAGLQVATVAAGGTVRPGARGREAAFARRIRRTPDGQAHPLLQGRPDVYDAPTIHSDEVAALPAGGTLLATNRVTAVQAAEIAHEGGVFWGVQYHPELSLGEIAAALRRQRQDLVEEGFATTDDEVEAYAGQIDALHAEPSRKDLAWLLGLDEQVTDAGQRMAELRNFIDLLVKPHRSARLRA